MGVYSDSIDPKPFKRPESPEGDDPDLHIRSKANKAKKRGLKQLGSLKKLTETGGLQPKAEAALRDSKVAINRFIDNLLFG